MHIKQKKNFFQAINGFPRSLESCVDVTTWSTLELISYIFPDAFVITCRIHWHTNIQRIQIALNMIRTNCLQKMSVIHLRRGKQSSSCDGCTETQQGWWDVLQAWKRVRDRRGEEWWKVERETIQMVIHLSFFLNHHKWWLIHCLEQTSCQDSYLKTLSSRSLSSRRTEARWHSTVFNNTVRFNKAQYISGLTNISRH